MSQDLFEIARFAVAWEFGRGGVGKALQLSRFKDDVSRYQIGPRRLVPVMATCIVVGELALATSHALGLALAPMAIGGAVLASLFAYAVTRALAKGLRIACGCRGAGDEDPISSLTLVRLGLLIFVELQIAFHAPLVQPAWRAVPAGTWHAYVGLGIACVILVDWLTAFPSVRILVHRLTGAARRAGKTRKVEQLW